MNIGAGLDILGTDKSLLVPGTEPPSNSVRAVYELAFVSGSVFCVKRLPLLKPAQKASAATRVASKLKKLLHSQGENNIKRIFGLFASFSNYSFT
jgi:hypothetical protein